MASERFTAALDAQIAGSPPRTSTSRSGRITRPDVPQLSDFFYASRRRSGSTR